MRYKFPMENILELRERQEKKEMEQMALIQNELKSKEDYGKKLIADKEESLEKKKNYKDFQELMYSDMYIASINKKLDENKKEIKIIREKLEKQRQKLVEAQKDKKIIERLKEKDMKRFKEKMAKEEQKELDEIAVLKYNSSSAFTS